MNFETFVSSQSWSDGTPLKEVVHKYKATLETRVALTLEEVHEAFERNGMQVQSNQTIVRAPTCTVPPGLGTQC